MPTPPRAPTEADALTPVDPGNLEGFPDTPAYRADYWPVYIAPSPASGERIVAGFVARGQDGRVDAFQAMSERSVRAVFGEASSRLTRLVSDALADASAHLMSSATLAAWAPAFEGVFAGPAGFMHGNDLAAALRSAAYLSGASFAVREIDQWRRSQLGDEEDEDEDPVRDQVKAQVLGVRPQLKGCFNTRLSSPDLTRRLRVYFAAARYACNVGRLAPDRLSYDEGRLKMMAFDLLAYRDQGFLAPSADRCELLVLHPQPNATVMGDKAAQTLRDSLKLFEEFADSENLRFVPIHDPADAARRILDRAEA